MTYREKLVQYKAGELDALEQEQVKQEIERQQAISEYLFEQEEIPGWEELLTEKELGDSGKGSGKDGEEDDEKDDEKDGEEAGSGSRKRGKPEAEEDSYTALLNRSIQRAFRRLGIAVLTAALAVTLFLQFGLPRLVSLFYYDPGRKETEDAQNQMSLDWAVYSELMLPGKQRDSVAVSAKGYGAYDIEILQSFSYTRNMTNVSGEILRGKLKLYDTNTLKEPTGNCFVWYQGPAGEGASLSRDLPEQYNMCAGGKREDSLEYLKELSEDGYYIAYVSLDQMTDYEDFYEFLRQWDEIGAPWCAVRTSESYDSFFRAQNLGFSCSMSSSHSFVWDETRYPDLIRWNIPAEAEDTGAIFEEERKKEGSEEAMQSHFVSLLSYLADQKAFLKMMGKDPRVYQEAADYVRENGIEVYGFAGIMKKDTILRLAQQEEVYEIYTEELR